MSSPIMPYLFGNPDLGHHVRPQSDCLSDRILHGFTCRPLPVTSTTHVPGPHPGPVGNWPVTWCCAAAHRLRRAVERDGRPGERCDSLRAPARTVPTVNAARLDVTGMKSDGGMRILGGRALSWRATVASGPLTSQPGCISPAPPAVGPVLSTHRRATLGCTDAQRRMPA